MSSPIVLFCLLLLCLLSPIESIEGVLEDLDELIMESPTHIDELWKSAVKEYSRQIQESEGGLGAICSKDEHCTDPSKKGQRSDFICGKNGRCKPNATDVEDACRWGLHTCMHKENSAIRHFAEQEVRDRLGHLDKDEDVRANNLQTALLPAPAQTMMALPAPPSMNNESTDDDMNAISALHTSGGSGSGSAISTAQAAYVDSLALVDNVARGALTSSGALPQDTGQWLGLAKAGKKRTTRRPFYNHWDKEDRSWRVATATAEHAQRVNASAMLKQKQYPTAKDEALMAWFKKGGGKLNFAEPNGRVDGSRKLQATEDITPNDLLLEVPLKLTLNQLTVRNIPTNQGHYLGHYMGGIFNKNQDWGLAALLLYELHKGNSSRWYPFIRTLDMHVLSKGILKELTGSWLAESLRQWEFEAEVMMKSIDKTVKDKDHMGKIRAWSTRKEMRWALWVVRRHGMWVNKITTGKRIRALVPYANYMRHRRGTGGATTVGLDNKIRIHYGTGLSSLEDGSEGDGARIGAELYFDKGDYSDTESMLRFHQVDDVSVDSEDNPFDRITVALPGAKDMNTEDVFWEWTSTKAWRRFMKYPPKQSDLWRLANKLQLYGEEWDEEEQKAISANNAALSGLPFSTDMVSAEEQLMLMGRASTEEEAQIMIYGQARDSTQVAQLYTAPDPEDDERVAKAMEEMADAMVQLQESVAAGHTDPSVMKTINETKAFFLHGIQPKRGLDDVDKLMIRKRFMMDMCGNQTEHWVSKRDVSPYLMCALRVHTMNETDMDILCPFTKPGAFFGDADDRECEGGGFDWDMGVSPTNENATIQALMDTLDTLLDGYSTTVAQDDAILNDNRVMLSPIKHSAIELRRREKLLIHGTMAWLKERRVNLLTLVVEHTETITDDDTNDTTTVTTNATFYQIEKVRLKEVARKENIRLRKIWREKIKQELSKPIPVASISIDLGGDIGKVNFTWSEGESLDDAALSFGVKYGLTYDGLDQLKKSAKPRIPKCPRVAFFMPVVLAHGVRAALRVNEGDNATLVADQFCAKHEIEEEATANIVQQVKERYLKRMNRSLLLTFPLDVPDGRTINFDVRQGEQHDLIRLVQDYSLAMRINIDVEQLANIAHKKLNTQIMEVPVDLPMQRRVVLRVRQGDEPRELVEAFCEFFDIDPVSAGTNILGAVLRGLNPGAIVVPQEPYVKKNVTELEKEKVGV